MAGAHPDMEHETPPKAGNGPGAKPAAHDGSVIDLVVRSTQIDEMEDLTNSLISSHRLTPLTKDGAFDSVLQIHGLQDFCGFSISYGRPVAGRLQDESSDERMAFVMAPKGSGQLIINRREFDVSAPNGVVFPAGPLRTLNHSDDCELSVLIMNRRKAAEHCAKLLAHDLDKNLQFDTAFDLTSANGQSWERLFQFATAELQIQVRCSALWPPPASSWSRRC
jgi:hypothetical protein